MYNGHIILTLLLVTAFPSILHGITTTHHDKPEESTISKMVNKMTDRVPSTKLSDRHKRLLPYINYYVSHNQRKPNREKFTPFLESNALPGPFIPIVKSTPKQQLVVQYSPGPPVPEKSPNYGAIYDTLVQLKQAQEAMRIKLTPVYQKPPIEYVPISYYNEPPTKTVVESYTPTNIDIDIDARKKYELLPNVEYKIYRHKPQIVDSYVLDRPIHDYRTQTANADQYFADKPIFVYQEKPVEHTQNEKPLTYEVETTPKPQVNTIVDDKYIAQKFTPVHTTQETVYPPVQYVSEKPNYVQYYSSPTPIVPTENTNVLAKLLKQLQNSNMLPQTFTPQNIDNSIKTLVKILNGLTKQSRLKTKPIVVVQEDSHEERVQENAEITEKPFDEKPQYTPVSFTQVFPANTIDGGTPGRPGIDYPALSSIPQTDFNCKKQRYKGFFGDPHTNCQVWHYCDLNGGQASFLCPNGTIFSQVALTCDWWYNVKCSSTAQLYVLNERLYKYILPLSPKFPEDYSGPLVDRYLALKFQEMEEKMKKERKKQDKTEEEKDDSDQLQELRNEKEKSSEES